MEIIIEGVIVHDTDNIEKFPIKLTESNHNLIVKKLELERAKIINHFKQLKIDGKIKSIHRPKNKKFQKDLDELCKIKKSMNTSIEKIKEIYRNI